MRHFGDITKLNGADVPPVDVITGGSPCQDFSTAGKMAGLAGARSGLFMEQIRVIKEMRDEDVRRGRAGEFVRPRFMVLENVPGLWSSNGGKDFATVLEETVRIVCKEAPAVPVPKGGWPHAGCLSGVGDGGVPFSVAWRLHDAQFWGVPQRRKRIALVADFGGLSAPEILFERKGLSGNSEPGGSAREETAGSAGGSVSSTITATYGTKWNGNAGAFSGGNFALEKKPDGADIAHALTARYDGSPQPDKGNGANIVCTNPCDPQTERAYVGDGAWHSLNANESGGQSRDAVLAAGFKAGQSKDGGIGFAEEQSPTLSATPSALELTVLAADVYNGSQDEFIAQTLTANAGSSNTAGPKVLSQTRKAYGISGYNSGAMKSANPHSGIYEADTSRTLDNNGGNPACNQGGIAVVTAGFSFGQSAKARSIGFEEEVSPTLRGGEGGNQKPCVLAYGFEPGAAKRLDTENRFVREKATTLRADMGDNQTSVLCLNDQGGIAIVASVDMRNGKENECVNGTLQSKPSGGTSLDLNNVVRVRRE